MSVQKVYLVISADRRTRVAKRPQIRLDEVAIAINLTFPDSWGSLIQALDVEVPDFAPEAELADEPARDELVDGAA